MKKCAKIFLSIVVMVICLISVDVEAATKQKVDTKGYTIDKSVDSNYYGSVKLTVKSKKGYKTTVSYTDTNGKDIKHTIKSGKKKAITLKCTTKISVKSTKGKKVVKGSYKFKVKTPKDTKGFSISDCGRKKVGSTNKELKVFKDKAKIKITAKKGYTVTVKEYKNKKWTKVKTIKSKKSAVLTYKKNTKIRVYYKKGKGKESYESYEFKVKKAKESEKEKLVKVEYETELKSGTYNCGFKEYYVLAKDDAKYRACLTTNGKTPTWDDDCECTLTEGTYTVKVAAFSWETKKRVSEIDTYKITIKPLNLEELLSKRSQEKPFYSVVGSPFGLVESCSYTYKVEEVVDWSDDLEELTGWEVKDVDIREIIGGKAYDLGTKVYNSGSQGLTHSDVTYSVEATFRNIANGKTKKIVIWEDTYNIVAMDELYQYTRRDYTGKGYYTYKGEEIRIQSLAYRNSYFDLGLGFQEVPYGIRTNTGNTDIKEYWFLDSPVKRDLSTITRSEAKRYQ